MTRTSRTVLTRATLSSTLVACLAAGCTTTDDDDFRSRASGESTLEADDAVEVLVAGKGQERRTNLSPHVRRARPVSLRLKELGLTGDARMVDVARAKRLDLQLFDNRNLRAELAVMSAPSSNEVVWRGRLVDREHGNVVISIVDGVAAGVVHVGTDTYEIVSAGDGYEVRELDTSALPPEGCDLAREPNVGERDGAASPPMTAEDGAMHDIDVLVTYTKAARDEAGGEAAMRAEIATAVALANTTYEQSGIRMTMRLAGAVEANYTESKNAGTDLTALTDPQDGIMDEVHAQRDALGADFVVLVTSALEEGLCGLGHLGKGTAAYAPYAFSVVKRSCIPNHTFTHELGHNMGAAHNLTNTTIDGAYTFSHGVQVPGKFRTVMGRECPAATRCPRIGYFSTPAGTFNGIPIGDAKSADNVRTLNLTAPASEAYRAASGAKNMAPSAAFTMTPPSGPAPLAVTFDASTSADSDGKIVSYEWSFGTGEAQPPAGSGPVVTHTFVNAGTYVVTLKVRDDKGAMSTRARALKVGASSANGPDAGGGFGSPTSPGPTTPATTCRSGRALCDGMCVRLESNDAHCGACGNACPAGADCRDGKCDCDGTVCNGRCVDLDDDDQSCGACGNACAAGTSCWDGTCE